MLNMQIKKGLTPLHIAAQDGNVNEVKRLLRNISSLSFTGMSHYLGDKDGNTPLHLAAANGHVECISTILNRISRDLELRKIAPKHSINAVNNSGETALHLAIQNNHPQCVELLAGYIHTSTSIRDANGQTALCLAVLLKRVELVDILVKKIRVNCDIQDENGDSIYDHVRRSSNQDLVKSLLYHYKIKETEETQEIKKSECIARNSKELSKHINGSIAATGTVTAATTTYIDYTEDSPDVEIEKSLAELTHAIKHTVSGLEKHIKEGCTEIAKGKELAKKEIAKGIELAKKAKIPVSKVGKIITANKGLFVAKTIATSSSIITCTLLIPVCAFYCVSHYYNKRQKSLSNTVGVCQKRQRALKDKCLELKREEKSSKKFEKEFSQLKSKIAGLQESQNSLNSRLGSKLDISNEGFLQVDNFRSRTRSYGEQDAKKSEHQRRPSLILQYIRIEEATCSKDINTTQV